MRPAGCAALAIAGALTLVPAAWADDGARQPWVRDKVLADATVADVEKEGILSVERHRADLEAALGGARQSIALAEKGDGETSYVLTDGPADTLLGLAEATTSGRETGRVVALPNPYPEIGFYLGSYYNEIGKPQDGLRVLDLALDAEPASGARHPLLVIERGASLNSLHRTQEALANFDEGLKAPDVEPALRASMLRGRGYSLTELGRLDEAQAAYGESLKLQPGNERALHELQYIEGLKAGGRPTQGYLATVRPDRPATAPATPPDPQPDP